MAVRSVVAHEVGRRQRSVGAVARHNEEHVVDTTRAKGLQAYLVTEAAAQRIVVRVAALQQLVGDEQQGVGRAATLYPSRSTSSAMRSSRS